MSMGKRKRDRQPAMWVTATDLPTAASPSRFQLPCATCRPASIVVTSSGVLTRFLLGAVFRNLAVHRDRDKPIASTILKLDDLAT